MTATKLLSDNGVTSGVSGYQLTGGNDGTLQIQTTTSGGTPTTALTIDTSQNVGIGTSSPWAKLTVNEGDIYALKTSGYPVIIASSVQAAGYAPPMLQLYRQGAASTATPDNSSIGQIRFDGYSPGGVYDNMAMIEVTCGTNASGGAPSAMAFSTASSGSNATERMRIDNSGNVGIGTTSPSTYGLSVAKPTGNNSGFRALSGGTAADFVISDAAGLFISNSSATLPTMFWINGSERMRIDGNGNLLFNSGYGSVATAYGCRAWVNFNGTGTVAIRASGNVSSITDNGVGLYTVNFAVALADANYAVNASSVGTTNLTGTGYTTNISNRDTANAVKTTTAISLGAVKNNDSAFVDVDSVSVSVFR